MGSIEWNRSEIDARVQAFAQSKAEELKARVDAKGIGTTLDGLSVIATDPSAMVREYGTASIEPDPWGIPSLMEMAQ